MRSFFLPMLLVIMLSSKALGWGIDAEFNDDIYAQTSLAAKAIKAGVVRYCLDISPAVQNQFTEENTKRTAEWALQAWLSALGALQPPAARVEYVPCSGKKDLRIIIGSAASDPTANGADTQYVTVSADPGENSIDVRLDTDYVWHETRDVSGATNGDYRWHSIADFVEPGQTLDSLIARLAGSERLTLDQFAQERKVAHPYVFWTDYVVFLHEFGHAFGLCDTVDGLFQRYCDARYVSQGEQPSSVMKDSNFFYLTDDDLQGLKALAGRLQQKVQ